MSTYYAELKTEEGDSADVYPWRYMSAQCPNNISRGIYAFFEVATHTCSHRNCKKLERRRVVVDGKERVEETPRECRFGYPRPLLGFMTSNSGCIRGSSFCEKPRSILHKHKKTASLEICNILLYSYLFLWIRSQAYLWTSLSVSSKCLTVRDSMVRDCRLCN